MQVIDLALFGLVFAVSYLILAVVVKLIHLITKDHSRSHAYRIAIIIFSLLFAGMVTYNNLGRTTSKKYPKVLQYQLISTPESTPQPSSSPTETPSPTTTPEETITL